MTPYIGQICLFAFAKPPKGWAICDGSSLKIAENSALYSLIMTTFGGDGINSFNLPDLRGRLPVHQGFGDQLTPRMMGDLFGWENMTLLTENLPTHTHMLQAASASPAISPSATPGPALTFATATGLTPYGYFQSTNSDVLNASAIQDTGNDMPHNNMMPSLVGNYCIAVEGLYPERTS